MINLQDKVRNRVLTPIRKSVPVPKDFVYDEIAVVGPIVIDLVRRSLSCGVEYQLMGHTIREGIQIMDGPRRVTEEKDGRIVVRVEHQNDFTDVWKVIEPVLIPEIEKIVYQNLAQKKGKKEVKDNDRGKAGKAS